VKKFCNIYVCDDKEEIFIIISTDYYSTYKQKKRYLEAKYRFLTGLKMISAKNFSP
jgi:hypothetical protein